MTISLHGFAGLAKDLRKLEPQIKKAIRPVVASEAARLRARIKRATPVDTGDLRSSVKTQVAGDGLTAVVYSDHEIARLIEFGGLRTRAQPYFLRTAARSGPSFRKAITKAIRGATK